MLRITNRDWFSYRMRPLALTSVAKTGYVPTSSVAVQVNVRPALRGTLEGQVTFARTWRWVRIDAAMARSVAMVLSVGVDPQPPSVRAMRPAAASPHR